MATSKHGSCIAAAGQPECRRRPSVNSRLRSDFGHRLYQRTLEGGVGIRSDRVFVRAEVDDDGPGLGVREHVLAVDRAAVAEPGAVGLHLAT